MQNPNTTELFGDVISRYTREQALEDGVLCDLSLVAPDVCRQHYKWPIACTSAVWDIVDKAVNNKKHLNDINGVVHDMLWMSKMMKRTIDRSTVMFRVKICGAGRKSLYDFKLNVGPGDDAKPVITIMLPEED
ncbi:hypothetical protein LCGC14_1574610 [marine sediment metagenome]|uniref:Uncharacterized protein n=1 Tax=marine sediment metagenome TaxID=412755 RepID=A0A0F9J4V5_9ZZZZ